MTKIKQYKNFYIVDTPKIEKYLSDNILDITSKEFKKANKNPIKEFGILIRATKVVDGKQKSKKKLFRYSNTDDKTLLEALKELEDQPAKLVAAIKSDAEIAEEKAKRKEQEMIAAEVEAKNKPLNDVWDEFYKHKTTGAKTTKWRDSTARNYDSFYNVWIRDTDLGSKPLSSITKDDCIAIIDKVAEQRALRTATTVIEILRPMFDWYFEKYEIDRRNPTPSKRDYKLEGEHDNKRVVDVTLAQVRKLYQVIDNYSDPLFRNVFIWLRTGRRRGEVVTMQMENIDTIDKSFTVLAKHNKAKVKMEYKLRPELEAAIREDYSPKDYLFESPVHKGQPIHVDSINKHWNVIKGKVGGTFKLNGKRVDFTELHLHDLRHIIAGVMKSAEIPEEVRGKVLGHKRKGITERYGLEYNDDIDRAYQLFVDIVYKNVPADTKWGMA